METENMTSGRGQPHSMPQLSKGTHGPTGIQTLKRPRKLIERMFCLLKLYGKTVGLLILGSLGTRKYGTKVMAK